MPTPLVLYSCQTDLATQINRIYYGDRHFVWCSPDFDAETARRRKSLTPPTAQPAVIYDSLWEEVTAGDRHSAKIASQKTGILRGATEKLKRGIITRAQRREIAAIVQQAQSPDFLPLVYVIPYSSVGSRAKRAPVAARAHPLSEEFIIRDLRRGEFEEIRLRRKP